MTASGRILILVVGILLLIGLVMLFSASSAQTERMGVSPYYFLIRQAVFAVLGLLAAGAATYIPAKRWVQFAPILYAVVVVMLVLVFVPGIGSNVKGSHRWINLGFFSFQPSEIAKFAAIAMLAGWYARKQRARGGMVRGLLVPFLFLLPMLGLVVLEPDFGATLLLGATSVVMMFVAGAPWLPLALAALLGASGVGVLIWKNPERMGRIMAFMDPETYASGEGYQLVNSIYGFFIGGPTGVGLSGSIQKRYYLPEAHTDFIFAVIAEELGVFGTLGVLLLFGAFLLCGMRISGTASTPEGRLMAFGITTLISMQAFINIGVVTGRLPTKGMPLPFISYGGTTLVITLFMVGVLLQIARNKKA